jgi:hypothetical protein
MGGSNCCAEAAVERASTVTAAIAIRVLVMVSPGGGHRPDYQDSQHDFDKLQANALSRVLRDEFLLPNREACASTMDDDHEHGAGKDEGGARAAAAPEQAYRLDHRR